MNGDLADVVVPDSIEEARSIWQAYSTRRQTYNVVRTVFSGISLVPGAVGLGALSGAHRVQQSESSTAGDV